MNCLDFRRRVNADPRLRTADTEGHLARCPACADYLKKLTGFEARLQETLRVAVPEGLADRVLLGRQLGRPSRWRWWLAAAAVLLAIGLATRWDAAVSESDPALAAIVHVTEHEPFERLFGRSGDPALLAATLGGSRVRLPESIGVRYLGRCPLPGGQGEHLVLETPLGEATLILMPAKPIASRLLVTARGKSALAAPDGPGSYAVVASTPQQVAAIARMLLQ